MYTEPRETWWLLCACTEPQMCSANVFKMWSGGWYGCRFEQCCKRTHVFLQEPVRKFIDYLRQSRPFADKIYFLSHNSRGYDAQFVLRKFMELRWTPQLIMDSTKILRMFVENLHFLDSLNFLPMSLQNMPITLDFTWKKGHYPHFLIGREFWLCGPLSWTKVLWGRPHVRW